MGSVSSLSSTSPRRRAGRRWLPYTGAVLLVLLIAFGLWPQPTPVETARVTVGPLRSTVNEEGKTRIKQRYVVSAPVVGQLRRIALKPGADVVAGESIVAEIDPLSPTLLDARSRSQAEAKRDTAQANLEKARFAHTFAASERQRFEKLYREKAISLQELEPVQWRETSAARDESAAEAALREAEAELAVFSPSIGGTNQVCATPVVVLAPASGRVLQVFQESARVVSVGTPLVEIGDPTNLEGVIEVLSRDGASIGPGTPVELAQWGGGPPLQGKVRLVEPAAFTKVSALGVEEQRVNVVVDLTSPASEWRSLGDNFRFEGRIVTWQTDHALQVPTGALFRRGDQWEIFVLEGGRARMRQVKTGRSGPLDTQILDGLKDGEVVILYPGDRVRDGARVKPVQVASTAPAASNH